MSIALNQRFTALDVFRGMTICLMIIVNTPGGSPTFSMLEHAAWNGFTPTDLVFPSFLFAVGNAMSFVMARWGNMSTAGVLGKIGKRTLVIFVLGFLMYWFPFVKHDESGQIIFSPLSETRIFGVLQRIALAYGAASLMIYFLKARVSAMVSMAILALYWPVMVFWGDAPDPFGAQTNAVLKLDILLFGENHLYRGEGFPFDPEGLLSTLPAIVNVVAGYLAGLYVQQKGNTYEGLAKLLMAGFVLFVMAQWWHLGFPINKKLWTSSFVLNTVGLDCMILACIIYWVDFLGKTKGVYFFRVFGRNPLFIYLLSEVGVILLYFFSIDGKPVYSWIYQQVFQQAGDYIASLLFATTWMLICWLAGYFLDRKNIYIKV